MESQISAIVLKNSHQFSPEEASQHSRMMAYEGIVSRTKNVTSEYRIIVRESQSQTPSTSGEEVVFVSPLNARTMPSSSNLELWVLELRKAPTGSYVQY